jgi:microsomal dipeptidase-like Zn-dependent dipeptidase
MPKLIAYLSSHGYSDALLDKIGCQNWLALLARSIG